ncbi:MAG: trypsin-like peptidase domain-containing protein [Desulfamplus sp.]|nr:trypsin-like peptidase domain-containing protein [Desulfamplus sp.]
MKISPGNAQHIGKRKEQQDSFGYSDIEDKEFVRHGGVLAVVADGMGGLACGADASRLAVKIMMREYMTKSEDEKVVEALKRSIITANEAVHSMAMEKGLEGETGTTLVAAVVKEKTLFWISAGDSRLYLLRNGNITLMTQDHNYANELAKEVKKGSITREEAANHRERNALTSFLGLTDLPEIDRNIRPFPLESGDRIMLCSDGLYNTLSEKEIAKGLKCPNPNDAAESLINDVLKQERKNQDNITVAILGLDEPETKKILKPSNSRGNKTIWSSSNNNENRKSWLPESRRKNITLLLLILILSCILLFVSRISAYAATPFEDMSKSTVRIFCIKGEQIGTGSGFVIDNGGKVVTNWHVVALTEQGAKAVVFLGENNMIKTQVKWHSEQKDLAVLELEKPLDRPDVVFMPVKKVVIGQTIYALGFPSAADDQFLDNASLSEVKATRGIISAKVNSQSGVGLFQIDAAINPGNSGGPLFDEFGQVLGINVAKALIAAVVVNPSGSLSSSGNAVSIERLPSGEGIGWAIQADELMEELDKLNISYRSASVLIDNSLYRLWKNDPLVFSFVAISIFIGVSGLFLGFTSKGRVVVKEVVSKSRDAITRRAAPTPLQVKHHAAVSEKPLLLGIAGEFQGSIIELDESPLVIGRDPRVSHLVFSQRDSGVSRRHCTVAFDSKSRCFYLEDSWSSNGTYLCFSPPRAGASQSGSKIQSGQKIRLSSGDRFYLSDENQMFEVRIENH